MKHEVYVIGGGNSLKDYNFSNLKDKDTIATNKAIFSVPDPTYFVTIDYTFLRKIDIEKFKSIKTTKVFVANLAFPQLEESNGRIVDVRFPLVYDLKLFDVVIKSRQSNGIGESFNTFCGGGSSGFCGLQLAIALGYTRIYLMGIDLIKSETTHYHGGYGEAPEKFNAKLDKYYEAFVQGIKEIQTKLPKVRVFTTSHDSRLVNILPYFPAP